MKRLIAFVLFLASYPAFASAVDSTQVAAIKKVAEQVRRAYAPDARDDIFEVNIQDGSVPSVTIETTRAEAVGNFQSALTREGIRATITQKVLPAAELGENTHGIISLSVVNNRLTPRNQAELVTQTLLGTPVRILKKDRGYYFVRTPDNYLSWVAASGVAEVSEAEITSWKQAEKVVFTKEFGHAFSQPSESSMPVSDLVHGVILKKGKTGNDFVQVIYPDKRVGYIRSENVMDYAKWAARPNPDAEKILAVGKMMMGVPYLWGGTSIKGVDCSGFTKTCYYLNGIVLPRDASQQAKVGETVDVFNGDSVSIKKCLANLKAGDLLFFGSFRPGREPSVTHTGIYMGNGLFIHSSGLVKINSMIEGAENYSDLVITGLVGAKRMLTAIGKPGVTRLDNHPYYVGRSAASTQ